MPGSAGEAAAGNLNCIDAESFMPLFPGDVMEAFGESVRDPTGTRERVKRRLPVDALPSYMQGDIILKPRVASRDGNYYDPNGSDERSKGACHRFLTLNFTYDEDAFSKDATYKDRHKEINDRMPAVMVATCKDMGKYLVDNLFDPIRCHWVFNAGYQSKPPKEFQFNMVALVDGYIAICEASSSWKDCTHYDVFPAAGGFFVEHALYKCWVALDVLFYNLKTIRMSAAELLDPYDGICLPCEWKETDPVTWNAKQRDMRGHMEAFAMGIHHRLGAGSPIKCLPENILKMVGEELASIETPMGYGEVTRLLHDHMRELGNPHVLQHEQQLSLP